MVLVVEYEELKQLTDDMYNLGYNKALDAAIATINNVGLDAADEKATQTAIQALKVNEDES